MYDILIISGSLILLYFGADWLVRGSSSLATKIGLSQLIIGLTIVSFGTSAPELVVSVKAAVGGNSAISIGNVIGSNIFNICLILGLAATISPVIVNKLLIRRDIPIMILATLLLIAMFIDYQISFTEGLVLIAGIAGYTIYGIYASRKQVKNQAKSDSPKGKKHPFWLDGILIIAGLGFLIAGASFLVDSAVNIAKSLGISEAIIGLTIVSAGTSLPELATSVVAAIKKKNDIAIGNIVGSNLFNILAILGTTGAIHPIRSNGFSMIDLGFLLGSALIVWPLAYTGRKIQRIEGLVLVIAYGVYLFLIWP